MKILFLTFLLHSSFGLADVTILNRSGKQAKFSVTDGAFKTESILLDSGNSKNIDFPRNFEVSFSPFKDNAQNSGPFKVEGCPSFLSITGGGKEPFAEPLQVTAIPPFLEDCNKLQVKNQSKGLVKFYLRSGNFLHDAQINSNTIHVVVMSTEVEVSSNLSADQKITVNRDKNSQINLDCDDMTPCKLVLE